MAPTSCFSSRLRAINASIEASTAALTAICLNAIKASIEASTKALTVRMASSNEAFNASRAAATKELVQLEAAIEVSNAQLGIAPSMIFPSSPTTTISLPTAAGMADHVVPATLQIVEVCDRQDALLETNKADFRASALRIANVGVYMQAMIIRSVS